MTLKDLLKKKDRIGDEAAAQPLPPRASADDAAARAPPPEFTFMRTTTSTQEVIAPPSFPGEQPPPKTPTGHHGAFLSPNDVSPGARSTPETRRSIFRTLSSAGSSPRGGENKRLSERLHLGGRSRSASSLVSLPSDLPAVDESVARSADDEAQWEKRATILAKGTLISKSGNLGDGGLEAPRRSPSPAGIDPGKDANIQEAIRLHEAGDLERSTEIFGRLADPNGTNNALSQVLYGLALRHGWGCPPNPELAVTYLSHAASNSAEIEALALQAGMKKGGAAKGELVLAMFELANSFRHGWGVKKDAPAARQYYETAANLGDTDAMNEAAWCYLEGFGGKKDKFKAAQFLRLAEEKGNKTIGNTW
ncbi:tetratricopeptide-like helical [Diplodia corticola]|uniref:Tetratricopeptide-like helical n=1 Tax=Diplodia corticola TaxID=236234 RepID=A0A1J9QSC9_9PEZI|nr:tetratricopeptide-like helical [Diplodia corticola]OJD30890.1 tetratricopeptide-like helical [Diplodia corticola]